MNNEKFDLEVYEWIVMINKNYHYILFEDPNTQFILGFENEQINLIFQKIG